MSYSYDRSSRQARAQPSHRGTLTYWLPLIFTVTVATVGVAAWIWSERKDDDEDQLSPPPGGYPPGDPYQQNYPPPPGSFPSQTPGYPPAGYPPPPGEPYGRNPDGSVRTGPPSYADVRPGEVAYGTTQQQQPQQPPQGYFAQMSGALGGALKRTPSPQQFIDGASRSVVAGVAAAGAVVGSALSSIREEDKNAYKDHKTWSEEAETRASGIAPIEMRSGSEPGVSAPRVPVSNGRRKTVAIVVSADTNDDGVVDEDDHFMEHAVCTPF